MRLRTLQEETILERALAHAEVAEMELNPRGGVNSSYEVRLADGEEGIFKPLAGVDRRVSAHYGHRPEQSLMHECAAWQLAKRLGEPYAQLVAPAVWRDIQGHEGVLIHRVSGDWFHFDRPFAIVPDQCMAAALFDSLSAQQDRHAANYLWDEADQRLHPIDHGYSFARAGDPINTTMFAAWRLSAAPQLTPTELNALRRAEATGALREVGGLLEPNRDAYLYDRAGLLVNTGQLLGVREFGNPRAPTAARTLDAELSDSLRLVRPTQGRSIDEAAAQACVQAEPRRSPSSPSRGIRRHR